LNLLDCGYFGSWLRSDGVKKKFKGIPHHARASRQHCNLAAQTPHLSLKKDIALVAQRMRDCQQDYFCLKKLPSGVGGVTFLANSDFNVSEPRTKRLSFNEFRKVKF
jgi:hypothetical protein